MTTQIKFGAIALASLAIWGTLFATSMWTKQAVATTTSPGIEITSLMSGVANLPAVEIAGLF